MRHRPLSIIIMFPHAGRSIAFASVPESPFRAVSSSIQAILCSLPSSLLWTWYWPSRAGSADGPDAPEGGSMTFVCKVGPFSGMIWRRVRGEVRRSSGYWGCGRRREPIELSVGERNLQSRPSSRRWQLKFTCDRSQIWAVIGSSDVRALWQESSWPNLLPQPPLGGSHMAARAERAWPPCQSPAARTIGRYPSRQPPARPRQ